jgi:hypothetical protein
VLGHAQLGAWALGELPRREASAAGAALELELEILPGSALGFAAGHAPGAVLILDLSLAPGAASGIIADVTVPGAILHLDLALEAGSAVGNVFQILTGGGRELYRDARARGARLKLDLSIVTGSVIIGSTAPGTVLRYAVSVSAGKAEGDAIGYDNDLVLLLAA